MRARDLAAESAFAPQDTPAPVPPRERTVVEGNIVEHPIWGLSNRQARPKRTMVDKETGKVLLEPGTRRPREYVDPADYTRTIDLGPDPSDFRKRRQLVIKADLHAGFPTMHAFRVLVVICERAHALQYSSQRVPITPTEIAKKLGLKEPGGKDYESIYGALDALENVQLCFIDTFYDRRTKSVHPGRRTERLVKRSVFKLRGAKTARPEESIPASGLSLPDASWKYTGEPEDYVELGDGLWTSLVAGYRHGLDLAYLNSLPSETAQRLYSYLTKKDRDSRFYEELVVNLGRRLGLAKLEPSGIRASLQPACEALRRRHGPDGKAFLTNFAFEGVRGRMKLLVEMNREKDSDPNGAADQRRRWLQDQRRRLGANL